MVSSIDKKILIVEDDKFLGGLLEKHLKKQGFDIYLAVDAEEGFKKIEENLPNLIILDLILPGVDGYEFLSRLKAEKGYSQIPVVILSNLGQKEEVEKGISLGAADFLIKSQLDMDDIVQKIKKVLNIN